MTLPASRPADPIICCAPPVAGCCSCMMRVVGRLAALRVTGATLPAVPPKPGPRPATPLDTLTGVGGAPPELSCGMLGARMLMLVVFSLAPAKLLPNGIGRTCRGVTVVPPGVVPAPPDVFAVPPSGVATAKRGLNCGPAFGFVLGEPAAETFDE